MDKVAKECREVTTTDEGVLAPGSRNGSGRGGPPLPGDTLEQAALKVLGEGDPWIKASYGELAASLWFQGLITTPYDKTETEVSVPGHPARLSTVRLVAPGAMPKLGKGGSLHSRQAIVHSLVHTESWAIDLSWDIIARFGRKEAMPREFFDDFVRVAQDEGRHFCLLAERLENMGSHYGAFPAHDGLWDSAEATAFDLSARLAIEHCVHEARGLDVLPTTISRFQKGGDKVTAELLETVILPEEITHCAAGVKWFTFFCLRLSNSESPSISGDNSYALQMNGTEFSGNKTFSPPTGHKMQSSVDPSRPSRQFTEDISSDALEFFGADRNGVGRSKAGTAAAEERSDKLGTSTSLSLEVYPQLEGISEDLASKQVATAFHLVVRKYFRGLLKPPFNKKARAAAGFAPNWYLPLSSERVPV